MAGLELDHKEGGAFYYGALGGVGGNVVGSGAEERFSLGNEILSA
jgi:hypothetical protein